MTTSPPESGKSAPLAEVLSAVANDYRRAVLRGLYQTDGNEMAFDTLTDHVATQVRATDGGRLVDDHRQHVRTSLHHIHLPKMEACGMIVRDTETNQIRNVTSERSKELLTMVESSEVPE